MNIKTVIILMIFKISYPITLFILLICFQICITGIMLYAKKKKLIPIWHINTTMPTKMKKKNVYQINVSYMIHKVTMYTRNNPACDCGN